MHCSESSRLTLLLAWFDRWITYCTFSRLPSLGGARFCVRPCCRCSPRSAAPWSAIFGKDALGSPAACPTIPFFSGYPCVYIQHTLFLGLRVRVRPLLDVLPFQFPCLYMVHYLFWPTDASFVQTGEYSPFMGPCRVTLQLHPMAFLYIFLCLSLHTGFWASFLY